MTPLMHWLIQFTNQSEWFIHEKSEWMIHSWKSTFMVLFCAFFQVIFGDEQLLYRKQLREDSLK